MVSADSGGSDSGRSKNNDEFWRELNVRVPHWQELQSTEKGKEWLLSTDPDTGKTRDEILQKAADNHDINKVVSLFRQMEYSIKYE